jgi:hypothetical protein
MRLRRSIIVLLLLLPAQLAVLSAHIANASVRANHPGNRAIASQSGPISNETTITYWADAAVATPVRADPSPQARAIDKIRLFTEDGFPENYLVLAQEVYPRLTWFEIRLPGRPNGRTGWVPEQALGVLHLTYQHLIVDGHRHRMTLYLAGKPIFSAPVGVGKPTTPTPAGNFWIREKFRVRANPFYGPFAFGTSDYSTLSEWPHGGVVGIHGTNEPALIPGAPSHGCIRMKDGDIAHLWQLLDVGTPVTIT